VGWLKKSWGWILAIILVAIAIAAFLVLISRGKRKEANRALADATDAWFGKAIQNKKEKITKLEQDIEANQPKIEKLTQEIEAGKKELKRKHGNLGLTAQEIAERFANLSI
jgi:uncharacterized protein HemX